MSAVPIELVALGIVGAVAFVCVLFSENAVTWAREEWRLMRMDTWKPDDASLTTSDERCLAVQARLEKAKAGMRKRGTKLLIEDRPAWQRINVMGKPDPDKVVKIRRAR